MTDQTETDAQAEIGRLRERLAELEQALAASERREQALRESEARLLLMAEGSDDGGWDWDILTDETHRSPSWFRMLGYEPSDFAQVADAWTRLLHPEDAARSWEELNRFLEGHTPTYDIEHRMLHKSGKVMWMVSRGKVSARDEQGRPIRMTGTLRDVTARRAAEEELRQNQRLLNALVEHSPAIIHVRDLDGRFLLVNKEHAALLGLSREEVIGKLDGELIPPEVMEVFRKSDRRVLDEGQPVVTEESVGEGDGRRTYLSIKFPIHDDAGKCVGIGGIATDLTERKRAEDERAALQERLIEAQRAALRELSTPLLPFAEDAVVMPLIGTIDSQRAQQFMETLLEGVTSQRARTVILDVTGVRALTTEVANALVQASRAVGLLGAEVVLTGIRPEVAMTLVGMGVDLGAIATHGSLRSGIAYALTREGARGTRSR